MVLRLCGSLCLLALFYFSTTLNVNAAETRPYMYRTLQTAQLQSLISSSSPSVPVVYETIATTTTGQQVTRYTTRNTVMNATRLGSIARSAVGGPAILAATAAFIAYDYFYDESEQQWLSNPTYPDGYNDSSVSSVCQQRSGVIVTDLSLEACLAFIHQYNNVNGVAERVRKTATTSTTTTWCVDYRNTGGTLLSCVNSNYWRVNSPTLSKDWDSPISLLPTPVSDLDLGEAIQDTSPQAVTDILNNPIQTGTWPDRWPEMLPTATDIEDQLGHDIEGAPIPVNPDQTITDGSTSLPPETSASGGGNMSTEWPTFCSWAGVVCDFIDWVKEEPELPENLPIPIKEIEVEDYNSSIPDTATCPVNIPFNITFPIVRTYELNMVPVCDLATDIRPFVLLSAYLLSAYILVGAIRS